LLEKVINRN